MTKDLTNSDIERQNILNNPYAISKMQDELDLGGVYWKDTLFLTKVQVAELFDVDTRTIERYLNSHSEELRKNGYTILQGKKLQELKKYSQTDIDVGLSAKSLGIFPFRAVLNIAMLLTESENARRIRSKMLDIAMGVILEKSGGYTKYINQRDENYLLSDFQQKNYRKAYVDALENHVEDFQFKGSTYTNKVYKVVFRENAREYRKVLKLSEGDNLRDTMYAEVLDLIASIENGLAGEIKKKSESSGRKITREELKEIFDSLTEHPLYEPLILKARTKMSSRDLCFREALHERIREYVQSIPQEDFDKFLGEKSKELEERIAETRDVFERLKDR